MGVWVFVILACFAALALGGTVWACVWLVGQVRLQMARNTPEHVAAVLAAETARTVRRVY